MNSFFVLFPLKDVLRGRCRHVFTSTYSINFEGLNDYNGGGGKGWIKWCLDRGWIEVEEKSDKGGVEQRKSSSHPVVRSCPCNIKYSAQFPPACAECFVPYTGVDVSSAWEIKSITYFLGIGNWKRWQCRENRFCTVLGNWYGKPLSVTYLNALAATNYWATTKFLLKSFVVWERWRI